MRTFTARSGMPGPHGAAVASQGTKGGESPASEARAGQRDCGSGVSKCVKTPPSYGFDKIRAACKAVYAGSIPTLASIKQSVRCVFLALTAARSPDSLLRCADWRRIEGVKA